MELRHGVNCTYLAQVCYCPSTLQLQSRRVNLLLGASEKALREFQGCQQLLVLRQWTGSHQGLLLVPETSCELLNHTRCAIRAMGLANGFERVSTM
jgi:hypothetical protein